MATYPILVALGHVSSATPQIILSGSLQDLSRKENPQKLTQLSSRSHPRHLVGKRQHKKTPAISHTGGHRLV